MKDRKKQKQPSGNQGPGAPKSKPAGAAGPPSARSGPPAASWKAAVEEARTKAFARFGSGQMALAEGGDKAIRLYQVQEGGRVLLATSSLSEPSADGSRPVGEGLEIFVESDEPLGGPLPVTWLQSLICGLHQLVRETGGLRQQIEELSLLSVGVDGAPFPPAMRGVEGTVGVLLGAPAPRYPSSYKVGNHKVLLVAATVLKPDELELLLESEDEGYEELASALAQSGVGHLSQLWRDSMVEELDDEDGEDEEDGEDGESDEEDRQGEEGEEGEEEGEGGGAPEAAGSGEEDEELGDAGPLIMPGQEGALADFPATKLQLELFRELQREDPQRNLMERFVHFRFVDEKLTEEHFSFVPRLLRDGWAILSIPGEKGAPDLCYTVGLHYRYRIPELAVASRGWPAEEVRRALSQVALRAALRQEAPAGAASAEGMPPLSFGAPSAEQQAAYPMTEAAFFAANFADSAPPPVLLALLG